MDEKNLENLGSTSNGDFSPLTEVKMGGVKQGGEDVNKKLVVAVALLFIIAVAGGLLVFNLYLKKQRQALQEKLNQTSSSQQPIQKLTPSRELSNFENEATEGAIPTISDDTSIETIEKEVESLNVEGIDQGDASIESDLQNL